jgi:hypothetical protein
MKLSFFIRLVTMSAFLFLAMMVSHFFIYKALVVPHLPGLSSVPFSWWLGVFTPELSIFLIFGFSLRSLRELMIFSVVAGFVQQVFGYLMATWNEPGHLKGFESAIFHWTLGLVAISFISAILFCLGMLLARALKPGMKFA